MNRIVSVFWSPTGSTRCAAASAARGMAAASGLPVAELDLTPPGARTQDYAFSDEDIVLLACPTYAGRIPNKIMPDLASHLHGGGHTPLIVLAVYGNRSPDECMRELALLGEGNGFVAVAGAECVAEHCFTRALAPGRPDEADRDSLAAFGSAAVKKALAVPPVPMALDRESPVAPYYSPKKADGTPAKFLKARPLTDEGKCTRCGQCVTHCPMGSIESDCVTVSGVCIKCQACVKICLAGAKYFDDPDLLSHMQMIAENYTDRKENKYYY